MKELSIEEKAKAYDKAIIKSREFLTLCKKCRAKDTIEFIEDIFPELKMDKEVDNQNCVKPFVKIEPKFKAGDWIVHQGTENIYQVVTIIDNYNKYVLKYGDNYTIQKCTDVDKCTRLWTIQDAKKSDILAFDDNTIVIFKNLYNATTFHSYCHIEDGLFNISKDEMPDWWESKKFKPATKEQQDLLFFKMKEAGYKLDKDFNVIKI